MNFLELLKFIFFEQPVIALILSLGVVQSLRLTILMTCETSSDRFIRMHVRNQIIALLKVADKRELTAFLCVNRYADGRKEFLKGYLVSAGLSKSKTKRILTRLYEAKASTDLAFLFFEDCWDTLKLPNQGVIVTLQQVDYCINWYKQINDRWKIKTLGVDLELCDIVDI